MLNVHYYLFVHVDWIDYQFILKFLHFISNLCNSCNFWNILLYTSKSTQKTTSLLIGKFDIKFFLNLNEFDHDLIKDLVCGAGYIEEAVLSDG